MEVKKGYKNSQFNKLSEKWNREKISKIALITTGAKNTQDKIDDGDYPFFVRSQQVERINSYSFDGEAILVAGDGVGTGKVMHYINGKFDFHQRVYKISDFDIKINGYFFYLYFKNNFLRRIMSMTAKSSVDSVRREMIANMLIPIPSLKEQSAIAEVLSETDSLTTNLEKLIKKKEAIKKGTMQALLTGKKRLPGFNRKWQKKKIKRLFKFLSTANNSRSELADEGQIGYIHYGDIHTRWSEFLDVSTETIPFIKKYKIKDVPFLENGDLLIADASEDYEGICACIELKNVNNREIVGGLHTLLLRGKKDEIADGFKGYLPHLRGFKEAVIRTATGISVYGISKKNLGEIEITIPDTNEQSAIAVVLADMTTEIKQLEEKLQKYKMIKKSMMQNLLTGKIRLV